MRNICLGSLLMAAMVAPTVPVSAAAADYPWDPSVYNNPRFGVSVETVAEGVHVMRRIPSWRTMVQANVTVIVNENDVVVVDSGTPAYVDNLVAEIKKITDKPVSTVITTHWHGDHNRGNHVYREAWPSVTFIAHQKTYVNMLHRDRDIDDYKKPGRIEEDRKYLTDLLAKWRTEGKHQSVLNQVTDTLAGLEEMHMSLKRSQSGLADITFEDKLVLKRGTRDIEILYLGRANTDGDAIIWLPNEKIVVTGDTVVRPTPYGFSSYPREWADTLERVKALGADVIVPGHGRIMHDTAYIDTLIHLFRDLSDQADAAVAAGADSAEAVKAAIDFSKHEQAITGGDPLFQRLFDGWFKTPISVSAFKAAKGDPILQYEEEE